MKGGRLCVGGADPLVRTGRPRPVFSLLSRHGATVEGPAADQGIGVKVCCIDRNILETQLSPATTRGGVRRLILTPMADQGRRPTIF